MGMVWQLESRAASLLDHRAAGRPARCWLGRPFRSGAAHRILIYRMQGVLGRSQLEPFFRFAPDLDTLGIQLRCRPVEEFLAGKPGPAADTILIQPWFTEADRLGPALDRLRSRQPAARLVFLDSYAHNDLRLGKVLEPHVEIYLKKSLFKDRREFLKPRRGDTNLTEFYGDLYGHAQTVTDWDVPVGMLDRLHLFPNFLTHTRFHSAFTKGRLPPRAGRRIDVHARLGVRGTPWYESMRQAAQKQLAAIPGLKLSPPGLVDVRTFLAELEDSRLCFSPFGYGEICWRDIEAFQTGAVLVKPDMSHLETLPDLYEAGATYLPVRWDFSDLEEVVTTALADEGRLQAIAEEAWRRCAGYLSGDRFLQDMRMVLPEPVRSNASGHLLALPS